MGELALLNEHRDLVGQFGLGKCLFGIWHAEIGEDISTADDVIHGLERDWKFDRKPEFNQDEWQWKYRLATESVDGDEIVVVIAVDAANRSFEVVTRWK